MAKCGKPNGYCLRCDDQTSYDYCKPVLPPPSEVKSCLSDITEAAFKVLGAVDEYNAKHGTFIGGACNGRLRSEDCFVQGNA